MCTAKSHFAAPLQPAAPGAEPEPPSGCYATDGGACRVKDNFLLPLDYRI